MKRCVFVTLGLIFFLSFISASFDVGNISHDLENIGYAPGADVKGWVNISFTNEASDSELEGFGDTVELIDLIEINEDLHDFEYDCNTKKCVDDYSSTSETSTLSLDMAYSQTKTIGLKITGAEVSINSIYFDFESDATDSCETQFEMDIGDDDSVEITNEKISSQTCADTKTYGCFDDDNTEIFDVALSEKESICQKVNLLASPGIGVGAFIKKTGDINSTIIFILKDKNRNEVGGAFCNTSSEITASGGEVSCVIKTKITTQADYYVCAKLENAAGYALPTHTTVEECGFIGDNSPSNVGYKIFASSKKFGKPESFNINNTEEIKNAIVDSISSRYKSTDCSNGCIVPIKIKSNTEQKITLKNLELNYDKTSNIPGQISSMFYEITGTPAKITTDKFQKLYLDYANFTLPTKVGNASFKLELNGEEVIKQMLSVKDVPIIKSISPIETFSAYPTLFKVNANASSSITSYEWDFGDGKTLKTTTNEATHSYNETKTYSLKITAKDSSGASSYKTFSINVGSPDVIINRTIVKLRSNFNLAMAEIGKHDSYTQKVIIAALNTENLNKELTAIERSYSSATGEISEYNEILTKLLAMSIPDKLSITKSSNPITFSPQKETIDLDAIAEITKSKYITAQADKYKDALIAWNYENLNTKVSFTEISSIYSGVEVPIARIFEIQTTKKETLSGEAPTLIIEKLTEMQLKENYGEVDHANHISIPMRREELSIIFSTTQDVDFQTLPALFSPSLNRIEIVDASDVKNPDEVEKPMKWGLFILMIFLIIIAGVGLYIFLQQWYKKNYEAYLFNGRNNMFNLITFIQGEKKKGSKNDKIEDLLHKSGWSGEQISYVMKKYAGKRTGMFELPIDWLVHLFDKKKALNKMDTMGAPAEQPINRQFKKLPSIGGNNRQIGFKRR